MKLYNEKENILDIFALIRLPLCIIAGIATITGMLIGIAYKTENLSLIDVFLIELIPFTAGFIVAFLFVGAANAINDYFDYESDIINKRYDRPLANNKLSRSFAFQLSLAFSFIGFIITFLFFDVIVFFVALFLVLLSYLYSMLLKKVILIGNIVVAFTTCGPYIYGVITQSIDLSDINLILAITLIIGVVFLGTWGREIIKDALDIEGDLANNISTLPNKIGIRFSAVISLFPISIAVIISFITFFIIFPNNLLFLIFILISDSLLIKANLILILKPTKIIAKNSRSLSRMALQVGSFSYLLAVLMMFPVIF